MKDDVVKDPALDLIGMERDRQRMKGFTDAHDDTHTDGQLAVSAMLVLCSVVLRSFTPTELLRSWALPCASHAIEKYKEDPVKRLVIAAAMIAADIDRRVRAGEKPAPTPPAARTVKLTGAMYLTNDEILDKLDRAGFNIRNPRGICYAWDGKDCTFTEPTG